MKILFLCTENACRSQIAEYLGRELDLEGAHEFYSAGTRPGTVNPRAIGTLRERAILADDAYSKDISEVPSDMDLVITLCDDAEQNCPVFPGSPRRLHWPTPDPAKFTGTEQEIRCHFADVRDQLERQITQLLEELGR